MVYAESISLPETVVRSLDASWNYARWSQLPDDGNRYEVIDGVLYITTAPSFFHQWIVSRMTRMLQTQALALSYSRQLVS